MKTRYKIALASIPFLLSALVLSAMTYPKYLEDKSRTTDLTAKQQQYQQTLDKLAQRTRAEQEKKSLETDIETLRNAVPKSPELDLAMIDLEKMCANSDVQLLGIETPSQETMRQISSSDSEIKELIGEQTGKAVAGAKSPQKPSTAPGAKPATENQPVDTGLKRLVKQVYVTGDYNGMVSLMKRLEGYQRTVGVENISIAIKSQTNEGGADRTPAGERAQKLSLSKPVMAFLMTLYYLP